MRHAKIVLALRRLRLTKTAQGLDRGGHCSARRAALAALAATRMWLCSSKMISCPVGPWTAACSFASSKSASLRRATQCGPPDHAPASQEADHAQRSLRRRTEVSAATATDRRCSEGAQESSDHAPTAQRSNGMGGGSDRGAVSGAERGGAGGGWGATGPSPSLRLRASMRSSSCSSGLRCARSDSPIGSINCKRHRHYRGRHEKHGIPSPRSTTPSEHTTKRRIQRRISAWFGQSVGGSVNLWWGGWVGGQVNGFRGGEWRARHGLRRASLVRLLA